MYLQNCFDSTVTFNDSLHHLFFNRSPAHTWTAIMIHPYVNIWGCKQTDRQTHTLKVFFCFFLPTVIGVRLKDWGTDQWSFHAGCRPGWLSWRSPQSSCFVVWLEPLELLLCIFTVWRAAIIYTFSGVLGNSPSLYIRLLQKLVRRKLRRRLIWKKKKRKVALRRGRKWAHIRSPEEHSSHNTGRRYLIWAIPESF